MVSIGNRNQKQWCGLRRQLCREGTPPMWRGQVTYSGSIWQFWWAPLCVSHVPSSKALPGWSWKQKHTCKWRFNTLEGTHVVELVEMEGQEAWERPNHWSEVCYAYGKANKESRQRSGRKIQATQKPETARLGEQLNGRAFVRHVGQSGWELPQCQ